MIENFTCPSFFSFLAIGQIWCEKQDRSLVCLWRVSLNFGLASWQLRPTEAVSFRISCWRRRRSSEPSQSCQWRTSPRSSFSVGSHSVRKKWFLKTILPLVSFFLHRRLGKSVWTYISAFSPAKKHTCRAKQRRLVGDYLRNDKVCEKWFSYYYYFAYSDTV